MEKAKRKKLGRRILSFLLTVALMGLLQVIPGTVRTAYAAQAGAFTVDGGEAGTDYAYADGVLTIKTATAMTIKNSNPEDPTTDTIVVTKGVSANITLAGVTIDVSATENACAFKIENDSTGSVIITLADGSTNILKSGGNCAGLQKNGIEGTLIIRGGTYGTGSLEATGGGGGAGIGGGGNKAGTGIIIKGGDVTAAGGDAYAGGAGIGGGGYGAGTDIIIEGGTVTATGGGINNFGGAGIGGGGYKAGSDITIEGGKVTATGGNYGAGIGGGYKGAGSDITIEGGKVTATGGGTSDISYGGAGIGGGCDGAGTGIIIKGGDVTATGGNYGAGIGGGNDGAGSEITIEGGTVTAQGGNAGAGIGGGEDGTGSDIRITGGTVTARGGRNGAGIGGGFNGAGNGIKITGGAVTTEGGDWGAGIGGGCNGTGSDIIISGGSVKATSIKTNKFGGGYKQASVTPTLEDGTAVYLLEIKNENSVDIVIDAKEYPAGHGEEKKIYAYLPAKTEADPNEVTVGVTCTGYYYDTTNDQWKQTTTHMHSDEDGNGICDDAGCSYVYNHADKDGNGICNKCMVYIAPKYANGCYRIANEGNLYWFAEYVNAGNINVNAELTADIDFNGWDFSLRPWTPICQTQSFHESATTGTGYSGTFDGKGYTISNLIVTGKSDAIYSYGLFGTVSGTVKNLGMIGYKYTLGNAKDARAGSVVGQVLAGGTIENCYSVRHTVDTDSSKIAGGIAGCNYGGTIRNCYAYDGTVNGHQTRWGGVVGDCKKDSTAPDLAQSYGTVLNCYTDDTRVVSTQSENATITKCELKDSTAFVSGEVAYLLNNGKTDDTRSWYQTLSGNPADKYPVLDSEHGTVYQVDKYDCPDDTEAEVSYSNTEEDIRAEEHSFEGCVCRICKNAVHKEFDEEGFCTGCGNGYEPAKQVSNTHHPKLNATHNGYYAIENAGQLYWFAEYVNDGNTRANAVLTADIVVNESLDNNPREWFPIGYYDAVSHKDIYLKGIFDGNNKTISGLYCDVREEGLSGVGLIGQISSGAEIKNVGVVDSYIKGYTGVGGVCGFNYGTVINCYNTGEVIGNNYVGGVCGSNYDGIITNCYNTGRVVGLKCNSGDYVGGVCGQLMSGKIENCYYLDTTAAGGIGEEESNGNAEAKTATWFASGEVAYLLNGTVTDGTQSWYQTLSGNPADEYPVLDSKHGTVYSVFKCDGETQIYRNVNENEPHEDADSDGYCDVCKTKMDGISATLAGYSLSLSGNIGVNFHMILDESVEYSKTAKMVFTLPDGRIEEVFVYETEKDENDRYVFTCKVAASEMNATITAQLVDGEQKGTVYTYTVKKYADYILDNSEEKAENYRDEYAAAAEMVQTMLDYGAVAESYFSEDANQTVDNETVEQIEVAYNQADKKKLQACIPEEPKENNGAFAYVGSSLVLESEIKVRHYFKLTGETKELAGLTECEVPDGEDENGSYYCYESDGIAAAKLGYMTECSVAGITIKYCPLSYITTVLANTNENLTGDTELQNLMKSLYLYYQATVDYQNQTQAGN